MNNPFLLNMDFSKVVTVLASERAWLTSPADGVSHVHLEREAGEYGHTTSFIRFDPGSSFPEHTHPQGEELYVLSGVFSDEFGDYPAGTYIRKPPGSKHRPFTREGFELFVKLDQFQAGDTDRVVIRREDQQWMPGIGNLRVCPLHSFEGENTALVLWPDKEVFQLHSHWGGEEIVVINGRFIDEYGEYPEGSWLRNPHMCSIIQGLKKKP